ncbi:MAG: hypothetical protein LC659_11500, partial [Myxococcales bacterium]|nr:hypothetical protein [Myxococcales bacterium]
MSESRKGGGDKSDELDDWASAIDEWDANLALPSPTAAPPKSEAQPEARSDASAAPTADAAPVPAQPTQRERSQTPAPPLDASPLPEPAAEEDPLMHLFDGDMELPEEAGQALGSLLGDAVKPPPPNAPSADEPTRKLDLEAELPEP